MTVTQILTAARNNLNSLNDTFWSDAELYNSLYRCELKLARKAFTIDNVYSVTTVAGTAQYIKPTRAISIWKVKYNGSPLALIDQREYDAMNPNSASSSGTPAYFMFYDEAFYLYPTPDDAQSLEVYTYDEPNDITSTSVLETPSVFHDILVDGLTFMMCPKDLGHPTTLLWKANWEAGLIEAESFARKRRRANKFSTVKTEESLNTTEWGIR